MSLLTVHKLFISGTIVIFIAYAGLELQHYTNGDAGALLGCSVGAAAAVCLALYLRWVWTHGPGNTPRR